MRYLNAASTSSFWFDETRSMTRVTIVVFVPGPKDWGSGALPGIPRPEDLSCDLVWIRPSGRFVLLHAAWEAICEIQIAELICCDPVRTVPATGVATGGAPARPGVPFRTDLGDG